MPMNNEWTERLRTPDQRKPSEIQVALEDSSTSTDSTYKEEDDSDENTDNEEEETDEEPEGLSAKRRRT
jgi:hypothetical protein